MTLEMHVQPNATGVYCGASCLFICLRNRLLRWTSAFDKTVRDLRTAPLRLKLGVISRKVSKRAEGKIYSEVLIPFEMDL